MADESAQEKTEEPTAKRKQKARDDGQIARSKDLTTFAVLITSTMGLYLFGGKVADSLLRIFKANLDSSREVIFDSNFMMLNLARSFGDALLSLIPFFACIIVSAIVGPTALGGFLFSGKSLAPKWSRMDPIAGLKRMFSLRSLVELFKGIGKVLLIIAVAYMLLRMMQDRLLALSTEPLRQGIAHSLELSLWAAIILSFATVVISIIDVPFQVWEHQKKMRMSRQDVKDELKDTEGKPEVKSKVRQLQMQMAQNRMMSSVPEADVVITNPSHYSVALKYDPENMRAPILVAKGVDFVALKIREIATAHKVETMASPPLARAIFHTTEVDDEVPEGLYVAVAQVLAYVFQLRAYRDGRGERPAYPPRPNIPRDLRY